MAEKEDERMTDGIAYPPRGLSRLEAARYVGMEDEAVPVDKAALLFFPHGGLNGDTLRRAIRAGSLKAERLGRRYFVTRQAVNEWRRQCQIVPKDSGSGSGKEKDGPLSTSSATVTKKLALDAGLAICEALTKGLPVTRQTRSAQTENNVISLKSTSGT